MVQRNCLVPNTSTSLQATLAAEVHLAEGQFIWDRASNDDDDNINNNIVKIKFSLCIIN
jgi:hypothetical protein